MRGPYWCGSVPAILGTPDINRLMRDLADELAELGSSTTLRLRLNQVIATIACHGSRTLWPEDEHGRNGRLAAADGDHASFGAVQSRTPDLG